MKNLFSLLFFLLVFISTSSIVAQETFPQNGVYDQREGLYAFTNATIYQSYNQKIDNATLLIKDGKIITVGTSVSIPSEAVVIDAKGKFIYPSFIDIYSDYGLKEEKKGGAPSSRRTQQMLSKKEGAYSWNEALRSEFKAHEHFDVDNKTAKDYRSIGFGSLLSHRMDGISRGSSTFVTLGEDRAHKVILKESVSHHLSLKKGSSKQSYPGSLMGGIALLRQTYLDGTWYENHGKKKETNLSLQAWNDLQTLPQIFEVRDVQGALRAAKLGKEYKVTYAIHGDGDEYKMLDEIKSTGATFILPVDFPKAYDVEDPYDALLVSLGQLKHWELAPSNPARLAEAGINIILTTNQLKDKSKFLSQLRKAIKHGLSPEAALKALTMTPAQLLGVDKMVGSLKKGMQANFLITSDEIFKKGTKIHHNWIQGKPHVFSDLSKKDLTGNYNLNVGDKNYALQVSGDQPEMKIFVNDSTNIKVKHAYKNGVIGLVFSPSKKEDQKIRLTGTVDGKEWSGSGSLINGDWVKWEAIYSSSPEATDKKDKKGKAKKESAEQEDKIGKVIYPFVAYGQKELPKAENYLIKNATVWTNEKEGILENADVFISNGKVKQVGKSLDIKDVITIDATGKHLTCGIVDEHSHIAISRGVNECTQANTAEVRIGDVIDAQDIDIYRQLAGGVTTSQLLHGSCNPVGGQSAIIKLRWGYSPEKMKFGNNDGFIKFALGENVKKSRSSSNNRFPDSRMGVEQVYVDAFTRAKEYEAKKKSGATDFRKDLEMETMIEILNAKRFISCHSYVQSEINMLMHVADDMGFRVNTFTHILEGYKVADKLKAHGAGASSFSDWWAYKYEVIDAIPYNGAILNDVGVVTAFNSDDAEMARRLNQEAAKAVLYGGVSEEDAWKFVTLNPAKLLHIDNRVGSIKEGKDADLVIWSDHPMSIYAKAEKTFIDGIKFFDREEDKKRQKEIKEERARLIQKSLSEKNGGASTQKPRKKWHKHYHCDDADDEMVD